MCNHAANAGSTFLLLSSVNICTPVSSRLVSCLQERASVMFCMCLYVCLCIRGACFPGLPTQARSAHSCCVVAFGAFCLRRIPALAGYAFAQVSSVLCRALPAAGSCFGENNISNFISVRWKPLQLIDVRGQSSFFLFCSTW